MSLCFRVLVSVFLKAHQNLINFDRALMRTSCVSNSCSNEALSSLNSAESYLLALLSESLSSPPSCSETLPATKSTAVTSFFFTSTSHQGTAVLLKEKLTLPYDQNFRLPLE